jgi:hypothetical protein
VSLRTDGQEWKHPVSCFFAGLGILDVCFSWLASLLLGVGSHKNAFPELYPNDEKRRPIRFKYSLTLFVREKGWILSGMFAICSSQLLTYSTHSF